MKKIVLVLLFTSFSVFSQSNIYVTVTGTCQPMTHEYQYNGLLNGKNDYIYVYGNTGLVFHISFDGTRWVAYEQGTPSEIAFYNTNVSTDIVPPFQGWTPDICNDGTLVISDINNIDLLPNKHIICYHNPKTNSIIINNDFKIENVTIYDTYGRKIIVVNDINEKKVEIKTYIHKGVYFIRLKTQDKYLLRKIIINSL